MSDDLDQKWNELLSAWGVNTVLARQEFDDVRDRYAESGRFYHTFEHVENMLAIVESLGEHARNLNVAKLATWLHDVVYDPRAADNEERSAQYAERLCKRLAIPEGRSVADLILATKTHEAAGHPDAEVLIDADLSILGASERDYRRYSENIRREYAWVPEAEYRAGRRQVLEQFLNRPQIFCLLSQLENAARANIAAEIARLGRD